MISPAANPAPAFGYEPTWTSVEIFTGEQRLTCELRITGRLRTRLNDNEPLLRVRNLTTLVASPAMPHLTGTPDGLLWRSHLVACAVVKGEIPDPDEPALAARPMLVEGSRWTISGQALFPAGAEPEMHLDQLGHARFWHLRDATVNAEWGGPPVSWTTPELYVNLEQALGVYLG